MKNRPNVVLLALGNDILGDDGVGHFAARSIGDEWNDFVHVEESAEAGLALLELLEGFDKALIVDSIMSGDHEPGTIVEFAIDDFRKVIAPSPHYAGLPEVIALAERLDIPLPSEIRILAMEVLEPFVVIEGLTPPVEKALPNLVTKIKNILHTWRQKSICTSIH